MRYAHAHFRSRDGKVVPAGTKGATIAYGTIARFNRWTAQPHENKREIARRARQQARA